MLINKKLKLLHDPRTNHLAGHCLESSSELITSKQHLLFNCDPFGENRKIPILPSTISFERFLIKLGVDHALEGHRNIIYSDGWFIDRVLPSNTSSDKILATDLDTGISRDSDFTKLNDFLPHKEVYIEGNVGLAVSTEPSNWGAFICRILPKLLRLKHIDCEKVVVYASSPRQLELINLIGLPNECLILQNPKLQYRFDSALFLSEPTTSLYIDPVALPLLKNLGDKFRVNPNRRLYISRSAGVGVLSARSCVNEINLEAELIKLGFEIVHPDQFSVREQINLFSNAELIVGCSGAGMFNSVFAPETAIVIEIESSSTWIYGHTCLFSSLGLRHGFIWGQQLNPELGKPHSPFMVDVPAVIKIVSGFI